MKKVTFDIVAKILKVIFFNFRRLCTRLVINLGCALRLVKMGEMDKMRTRICVSTRDLGTYLIAHKYPLNAQEGLEVYFLV